MQITQEKNDQAAAAALLIYFAELLLQQLQLRLDVFDRRIVPCRPPQLAAALYNLHREFYALVLVGHGTAFQFIFI